MSIVLLFYFAGVSESLQMSILILGFIAALAAVPMVVEQFGGSTQRKLVVAAVPVCLLIASILPSKSTIYQMAAAYGVSEVIANPDVQRLAGKSLALVEKTLDGYLKEGK